MTTFTSQKFYFPRLSSSGTTVPKIIPFEDNLTLFFPLRQLHSLDPRNAMLLVHTSDYEKVMKEYPFLKKSWGTTFFPGVGIIKTFAPAEDSFFTEVHREGLALPVAPPTSFNEGASTPCPWCSFPWIWEEKTPAICECRRCHGCVCVARTQDVDRRMTPGLWRQVVTSSLKQSKESLSSKLSTTVLETL